MADTAERIDQLVRAMTDWRAQVGDPAPHGIRLPSPNELQLESVMLPRDAFFGPTDMVPVEDAAGRIAAEQLTPYPPGIPAVVPGECLDAAVLEYLRTGVEAGMNVPDAADPELKTIRVVARTATR